MKSFPNPTSRINPVQAAADDWQAAAIEKCLENSEKYEALGLCPVCMCGEPCLCTEQQITNDMFSYFMAHRDGDHDLAKSVNWGAGNPLREMVRHIVSQTLWLSGANQAHRHAHRLTQAITAALAILPTAGEAARILRVAAEINAADIDDLDGSDDDADVDSDEGCDV